uniref:Uncharacterized protein n=1 Tax=Anguilla anguilla TaxID=7936 RepID=A0A0E9QLX6_ANGAN
MPLCYLPPARPGRRPARFPRSPRPPPAAHPAS